MGSIAKMKNDNFQEGSTGFQGLKYCTQVSLKTNFNNFPFLSSIQKLDSSLFSHTITQYLAQLNSSTSSFVCLFFREFIRALAFKSLTDSCPLLLIKAEPLLYFCNFPYKDLFSRFLILVFLVLRYWFYQGCLRMLDSDEKLDKYFELCHCWEVSCRKLSYGKYSRRGGPSCWIEEKVLSQVGKSWLSILVCVGSWVHQFY